MKLFGILVFVALVLVAPNDGKRPKKRRNIPIVEEVEKIKAKVEELTTKVQELQEQSRGVHIHIGDGHHDTEHHHSHHDDHHHTHDDDNDDDSGSQEDNSESTETSEESTSTSDESDSSSSSDESDSTENSDDTQSAKHHDNGHHSNEHSHHGHHHDHHHNQHHRHHPNAENIYVNMKLQGGCHDDKHTKDHHEEEHEIHAHCEIMPNKEITDLAYRVRGHVKLSQKPGQDNISLDYNLRNLIPSHSHAVHIHEGGNMERCCDSLGGHYNPHRKQHGLPSSDEAFDSHVGDLGNVAADDEGNHVSEQTMHADLLDMIGRSFVIHEGTDTGEGNQGRKIACCVIGRAHENHHDDHSHHSHHGDHGHHNHHHHDDHEHDGDHDHSNHHHHDDQS